MAALLVLGAALSAVALALAWPIPEALARATLDRHPAALLALWQLVGLVGGLSLIAAIVLLGLLPSLHALFHDGSASSELSWWQWAVLGAALIVLARLLWCLAAQYVRAQRARRHHAELVRLLTSPSEAYPGTRLLASDVPLAYCVPGALGATVLSTGLLDTLSEEQRQAVIAHESAHLRFHHQLLIIPFAAWHRALPFLPVTTTALSAVSALVEFMADDAAVQQAGRTALIGAIETSDGIHPGETTAALTKVRLARL